MSNKQQFWFAPTMLLRDVYEPYGSLEGAGLKKIGRKGETLILTFKDGTEKIVKNGERIPLP